MPFISSCKRKCLFLVEGDPPTLDHGSVYLGVETAVIIDMLLTCSIRASSVMMVEWALKSGGKLAKMKPKWWFSKQLKDLLVLSGSVILVLVILREKNPIVFSGYSLILHMFYENTNILFILFMIYCLFFLLFIIHPKNQQHLVI